jgi:hypothetical protein
LRFVISLKRVPSPRLTLYSLSMRRRKLGVEITKQIRKFSSTRVDAFVDGRIAIRQDLHRIVRKRFATMAAAGLDCSTFSSCRIRFNSASRSGVYSSR